MNDLSPNPFSGHGGERDAPRSQAPGVPAVGRSGGKP